MATSLFTSNSIFYGLHKLFGVYSPPFFLLVFATHLLAVWLLYLTIRCFTRSAILGVVGAALWGFNPVSQGSLGWYSVYGHVLVAPCILWVLLDLARISRRERTATRLSMARWSFLLLIAGTSFGVGLGIALAFPPVAYLLLPRTEPRRAAIAACFALVAVLLFVWYLSARACFVATTSDVVITSQIDAMRANMRGSLGSFTSLLAYGTTNLLLGPLVTCAKDAVTSGPLQGTSLADILRISNVVLIATVAAIATAIVCCGAERRRELLGLSLLALSAYALIGLARPSTITVPSIPRYHYVAPACIAILLCQTLSCFRWRAFARVVWLPSALLAAWFAATFGLYLQAGREIEAYAGKHTLMHYLTAQFRMAKLSTTNC